MMRISKREFNAAINQAYMRGYNQGLSTGRQEAVWKRNSINDIRKAFGFGPLNEVKKDDSESRLEDTEETT